jgi:hypothetical protein
VRWSASPVIAGSVFFDLDYLTLFLLPVAIVIVLIAAACCWVFLRTADWRCVWFALLLGGIDLIFFLGPDLALHQTHSVQSRYLTPLWLAIEIATAAGLVTAARAESGWERMIGRSGGATLFAAGIVSCTVSSAAHSWWLASNGVPYRASPCGWRRSRRARRSCMSTTMLSSWN